MPGSLGALVEVVGFSPVCGAAGLPGVALELKVRDVRRGQTVEQALEAAHAQLRTRANLVRCDDGLHEQSGRSWELGTWLRDTLT